MASNAFKLKLIIEILFYKLLFCLRTEKAYDFKYNQSLNYYTDSHSAKDIVHDRFTVKDRQKHYSKKQICSQIFVKRFLSSRFKYRDLLIIRNARFCLHVLTLRNKS